MSSQKLSRGRFVQIIIMLTLLISMFFWRTFTFNSAQNISCNLQQKCTFTVNGALFSASKSGQQITLNRPSNKWRLSIEDISIKIIENKENWLIDSQKRSKLTMNLSNSAQNSKTVLIFEMH